MKELKSTFTNVIFFCAFVVLMAGCGGGGGGGDNSGSNSDTGVNPTVDTTAPSAPAGLMAKAVSSSQIDISWTGSSDNTGVTGYKVYREVTYLKTVPTGTTTSDAGLLVGTNYCYTVSAIDAASNESSQSSQACATPQDIIVVHVPDTGQIASYTSTFGEDSDYLYHPPSYLDNGDNTITDNVTGLVWQKQDDGTTRTWDTAVTYCNDLTLGGYSGWRLPSKYELVNIVDYGIDTWPDINSTYFPGTQRTAYWTASNYPGLATGAWIVDFGNGRVPCYNTSGSYYARCVHGEQSATQSFRDNGDGTVTATITGLMWQKQDDGTRRTWDPAIAYCDGLSLGGYADWRLPNIKELASLADITADYPAINPTYFPNTIIDGVTGYWSSTTYANYSGRGWHVWFGDGSIYNPAKTTSNAVRCVRGGQ